MTDNNLGRDLPEVPDVPSPLSEPVPGPIEANIPPVPPPLPVPPVPPTPPVPPVPPIPPTTSAMSGNPMGGSSLPPMTPPPVTPPAAGGYTAPPLPPPPAASPPLSPGGGSTFSSSGGRSDMLGWIGLVCGVLATGCCCCPWLNGLPWIGGIPAIILGYLHLQKVKKGQASTSWLAWAAIALGVLAILGAICGGFTNFDDQVREQLPSQFQGNY